MATRAASDRVRPLGRGGFGFDPRFWDPAPVAAEGFVAVFCEPLRAAVENSTRLLQVVRPRKGAGVPSQELDGLVYGLTGLLTVDLGATEERVACFEQHVAARMYATNRQIQVSPEVYWFSLNLARLDVARSSAAELGIEAVVGRFLPRCHPGFAADPRAGVDMVSRFRRGMEEGAAFLRKHRSLLCSRTPSGARTAGSGGV